MAGIVRAKMLRWDEHGMFGSSRSNDRGGRRTQSIYSRAVEFKIGELK